MGKGKGRSEMTHRLPMPINRCHMGGAAFTFCGWIGQGLDCGCECGWIGMVTPVLSSSEKNLVPWPCICILNDIQVVQW